MLARWRELDILFTKTYEDNASGKLSDERFMMIPSGMMMNSLPSKRISPPCKRSL